MLIILDYDETYTVDPEFWNQFVVNAHEIGHEVICCTMRSENDYYNFDVIRDMTFLNVPIIYAAEFADKWEAVQQAGYNPENAVWIDDRPMYVFMDKNRELPN
jgi:hypothetical protein